MEHHVRKAIALDRNRAEIEQFPGLPRVPETDFFAGDDDANALDGGAEPQGIEYACAVGADLHTGAELFKLRRLLEHFHIDALAEQRERCGKPSDAATDNCDLVQHGRAYIMTGKATLRGVKQMGGMRLWLAISAVVLGLAAGPASAQDKYPNRPV